MFRSRLPLDTYGMPHAPKPAPVPAPSNVAECIILTVIALASIALPFAVWLS